MVRSLKRMTTSSSSKTFEPRSTNDDLNCGCSTTENTTSVATTPKLMFNLQFLAMMSSPAAAFALVGVTSHVSPPIFLTRSA